MTNFSFDRELRFGDCDPSGIAYFPSYLNILNGVVEEFWAAIGFPWPGLITVRKIGTVAEIARRGMGDQDVKRPAMPELVPIQAWSHFQNHPANLPFAELERLTLAIFRRSGNAGK